MDAFQALVLGIVQGLTEFLPISSSAHLRITAAIAGWGDPGAAFTAVTQIGTETAVVLYLREDIVRIVRAWWRSVKGRRVDGDPDARLAWLVVVGSVPIALLGLLFEDQIHDAFRDLRLTALTLIVFGLILGWADRIARQERELDDLTTRHGVLYGLAQALALIPGVSRSGGTTTAGLLLGYSRVAATRYAFLLAIPAVYASGFYQLTDIGGENGAPWGATLFATVVAFAVGYAVVAWLLRYIATHDFRPFVIYRLGLGLLLFALVGFGALDPEAGPIL